MVIHCLAGHHRTGIMIYIILRFAFDFSRTQATAAMEDMRPEMHAEFFRRPSNRREGLQPMTEVILRCLRGR